MNHSPTANNIEGCKSVPTLADFPSITHDIVGKSFFLNNLAGGTVTKKGEEKKGVGEGGFKVGATTESCTRYVLKQTKTLSCLTLIDHVTNDTYECS